MDSVDERYKTPVLESLRMHLTAALELADQLGGSEAEETGHCVSSRVKSALNEVELELGCVDALRAMMVLASAQRPARPPDPAKTPPRARAERVRETLGCVYGWTDTRAIHVAGKYVDGKWGVSCYRGSFPNGGGGEVITGGNLSDLLRLVAKRVEDDDSAADAIRTSNTEEN
jgi:hypothetical protein